MSRIDDIDAIRAEFPQLARIIHGKPLVYFDNANTAQKPHAVIAAVSGFTNAEEDAAGLTDKVPFLLDTKLRERGADFQPGALWSSQTAISERLITGQNPQSAKAVGELIVKAAASL